MATLLGLDVLKARKTREDDLIDMESRNRKTEALYYIFYWAITFSMLSFLVLPIPLFNRNKNALYYTIGVILLRDIAATRVVYLKNVKKINDFLVGSIYLLAGYEPSFNFVYHCVVVYTIIMCINLERWKLEGLCKITVFLYSEIFSVFFFNQPLGLVDTIFLGSLLFIFSVSRYNKGAVKIASIFKSLYIQLFMIILIFVVYGVESTNFSDTKDLITEIPRLLKHSISHSLVYIGIIVAFLLGIEHNKHVVDLEMEIGSYEYYFQLSYLYFVN